jgi:antitoxin component YwqK of YwqJK toxin-antitoxin module
VCGWVDEEIPKAVDCAGLPHEASRLAIGLKLAQGRAELLRPVKALNWSNLQVGVDQLLEQIVRKCPECIDRAPFSKADGEICAPCFVRPFEGPYHVRYENGNRRTQGHYASGKKHGPWKEWFTNGRLKSEGGYEAGEPHGRSIERDEQGRLLRETNYRGGQLHGARKSFEAGRIHEHAIFDGGVPAGRWLAWFPDGRLKWQKQYESVCEGGKCESRLHGHWLEWGVDGRMTRSERYIHGKLEKPK